MAVPMMISMLMLTSMLMMSRAFDVSHLQDLSAPRDVVLIALALRWLWMVNMGMWQLVHSGAKHTNPGPQLDGPLAD